MNAKKKPPWIAPRRLIVWLFFVCEPFGVRGKTIFVGDLTEYAAGIAHSERVGRNIPHDDRTRTDYAAFSDFHGSANGNAARDPTVVFNRDAARAFKVGDVARLFVEKGVAIFVAQGVNGSENGNVRADENVFPDIHLPFVQDGEIKVCIAPVTHGDIAPEIEINRALQIDAFATIRQKLGKNLFPLFRVRFVRFIISVLRQ